MNPKFIKHTYRSLVKELQLASVEFCVLAIVARAKSVSARLIMRGVDAIFVLDSAGEVRVVPIFGDRMYGEER